MANFFIVHSTPNGSWDAFGVYTGTDGTDACGVAALAKNMQGKFTAFPLDDTAVTVSIEIAPQAIATEVPFSDE